MTIASNALIPTVQDVGDAHCPQLSLREPLAVRAIRHSDILLPDTLCHLSQHVATLGADIARCLDSKGETHIYQYKSKNMIDSRNHLLGELSVHLLAIFVQE